MKINIATYSDACIDFLTFFPLNDGDTLHVEYEEPRYLGNLPDFAENKFGWKSWLKFHSYSYLRDIDYSDYDLDEVSIKSEIFPVSTFIKKYKTITSEKLRSLFFTEIEDGKFETMIMRDHLKQRDKLKINEKCFGVSLQFIYQYENDAYQVKESDVSEAYEQLKIFYSSFAKKYDPSLLYLLPHHDPDISEEIEIIEGRFHIEYDSPDEENDSSALIDEMREQEERTMDEETNGFWRWNID